MPVQPGGVDLSCEEISLRLRHRCSEGAAAHSTDSPGIPAAVLIGLLPTASGVQVILTRRTAHLANHPSEISFPGGRMEAGDDSPADTALRESFEEIGLPPHQVEILGCLPSYRTISDYRVYPYVGWVQPPLEFTPDPHEVDDVFLVPLSFILDPANQKRDSIVCDGRERRFWVIAYPGYYIWGATAGMLVNLSRALTGC